MDVAPGEAGEEPGAVGGEDLRRLGEHGRILGGRRATEHHGDRLPLGQQRHRLVGQLDERAARLAVQGVAGVAGQA